jgi:integrase
VVAIVKNAMEPAWILVIVKVLDTPDGKHCMDCQVPLWRRFATRVPQEKMTVHLQVRRQEMNTAIVRKLVVGKRTWKGTGGKESSAWGFTLTVEMEGKSKRVRKSGYWDKKGAEEAARQAIKEMTEETRWQGSNVSLHNVLEAYRDTALDRLSPKGQKTEACDVGLILCRVPNLSLSEVKPSLVERFIKMRREEKVSVFTVKRQVGVLDRAIQRAVREGLTKTNPIRPLPRIKIPRLDPVAPTRQEVERLLQVAEGWLKVAVCLAVGCGLRKSEVLSLRWEDIDLEGERLRVSASLAFVPKGRKGRNLPVPSFLLEVLTDWKREEGGISPLVFQGSKEGQTRKWFDGPWRALKSKAQVKCRFHDLRHFFAVSTATAGAPAIALQAAMGHTSIQTTMIYLRGQESVGMDVRDFQPRFKI